MTPSLPHYCIDTSSLINWWDEDYTPEVFEGLPDRPAESAQADCDIHLSPTTTAALRGLATAHDLTLNTLVQGAWALLLSRYSGESDVVFGATRACRYGTIPSPMKPSGRLSTRCPSAPPSTPRLP